MRFRLAVASLGLAVPVAVHAQTINFHNANQGYAYYGGYNVLMYGQGAYSDPGNNVWNGFGNYGGPSSTDFYGGGNPDSAHGSVPSGNPGNPYAWHSGTSSSGTNLFSPANYGASNVGNAYSNGTISPVTLSLSYPNGDNGANQVGVGGIVQGSPNKIFSEASLVGSTGVGTITLGGVPSGPTGTTYDLFLYGANYNGDRGAVFNVTSSSFNAVGGFTEALNPATGGPLNSYILGGDYVEFTGITPNSAGQIIATWSAINNTISGNTGEGDFNGLQLVTVAPAGSLFVYYGYDNLNASGTSDGTFGGSGKNFNNSGSAVAFSNGSTGATALFDDSAPGPHTISIVSGGVSPNLTTFNNSQSTYTLTGGPISGPGSLSITGGGTVFINNSNSYTGLTAITNGTLVLNPGSSLASASVQVISGSNLNIPTGTVAGKLTSSSLAVSDYGTINLGGSANLGSLTGNGTVAFNVSGTTLTLTGGSFSGTLTASASTLKLAGAGGNYSGTINDGSSPNSVVVNTIGTWNISGGNTYSGGTTLTAGVARAAQSGFSTGPVILAGGQIGGIPGDPAAQVPGIVSGAALVVASGSGALELQNSANTFTGPIIVQGGALQLDSTGSIAGLNGANASSGYMIVASGGSLIANDNSGYLGLTGGVSSGVPIPLQITGSGNGSNGALQGGNNATSAYAGPITVVGPSTISAGMASQFTVTGTISGSSPITFGANSSDDGYSTLVLAPKTSNTYTGETQVSGDPSVLGALTVQLGTNNGFSTASGLNVVYGPANGLTVDLNNFNQKLVYLAGSNNSNYSVTTSNGASVLTVTSGLRGGVPSFFGTTLQGNVTLVMNDPTGLGNQIIAGNNSYSGGTNIIHGTLTAASSNALGNGPVLLSGGTLALNLPGAPVAGTAIVTPTSFTSSTVTLNNGAGAAPSISGNTMQLTTNGVGNTANSIFYNTKVPVSDSLGFTVSFNYNCSAGYADGIAFVLQNDPRGTLAVSTGAGGSLGYQGTGKITNSAAVAFEDYPFASTFGSGFGQNGVLPGNGGLPGYTNTAPVNIGTENIGGNVYLYNQPVDVTLVYNGPAETLTETLFGDLQDTTFTTTWTGIDYASLLGGTPGGSTTAYLGFTGGTGGATSTQYISNFTYAQNQTYSATAAGSPTSISNPINAAAGTTSSIQIGVSAANNSGGAVGAINIGSGATVTETVTSTIRGVLFTPSISIATTSAGAFLGKLDIGTNDLVVTSSTLQTVTAMVASGYKNGTWTGEGITSSAAASNTKHLTAVGVILNDTQQGGGGSPLYGNNGGISSTFDGSVPSQDNVLVKYTYYGDSNLDGAVDGSDYALIDAAYLSEGFVKGVMTGPAASGWYNGDFNYDGVVNGSDYTLMDNAFNQQGTSLGVNPAGQIGSPTALVAGGSAVPEPTSLALLGVAATGLLSRRRRRA